MTTEVRQDGIYYRQTRKDKSFNKISFDEIQYYWIRDFSLFSKSKDSNIVRRRLKSNEKNHIMRGKIGIQIELKDDNELLLGTQKPEEFTRAIDSALGK